MSKPQNPYCREQIFGYATMRSGRANATNTGKRVIILNVAMQDNFLVTLHREKIKVVLAQRHPEEYQLKGGSDIEERREKNYQTILVFKLFNKMETL